VQHHGDQLRVLLSKPQGPLDICKVTTRFFNFVKKRNGAILREQKGLMSIANSVVMYEAQLTQKSLSNQAGFQASCWSTDSFCGEKLA